MSLVIDGYNLLHASGILGRGVGPGSLERSRNALINFLIESLEGPELAQTTLVFDAREAPPGLPRVVKRGGLTVRFAEPGSDADDVIERLILANSTPRRLTVVSSDHRLHRAARRRRAKPIDSDQWYVQTLRKRMDRLNRKTPGGFKPDEPSSEGEVMFWLRHFGMEETGPAQQASAGQSPADQTPSDSPFPPGYGEDINEENA